MKLYLPYNTPTIELPEPPPKKGIIERAVKSHPWRFAFGNAGILTLVIAAYVAFKPSTKPGNSTAVQHASIFGTQSPTAEPSVNNAVDRLESVQNPSSALCDWLTGYYPAGWVLLGSENGQLIHKDHFVKAKINADWENAILIVDRTNQVVRIAVPKISVESVEFKGLIDIVSGGNLFEVISNKTYEIKRIQFFSADNLKLYLNALYEKQGIFALGLSDDDLFNFPGEAGVFRAPSH